MKQQQKFKTGKAPKIVALLILCFFINKMSVSAQDSAINEPSIDIRYFVNNNSAQYLLVRTRVKTGRKYKPLPNRQALVYLDSSTADNLIAKTVTNENGEAKIIISPTLKDIWNSSAKHSFTATLPASGKDAEVTASLDITKTKILIDTVNDGGTRTINVKVLMLSNNDWVPAKDVEMSIGVERNSSVLSAGSKETYTTDSAGVASVEFSRDSLPGDAKGNFVLAAKVENNELFGNLFVEKTVPWGIALKQDSGFFDQRTLWSTRFRTPFWLLFMAYSIMAGVWGTIVYLVFQIVKIKRLGDADATTPAIL